jgi:hypothetical protein
MRPDARGFDRAPSLHRLFFKLPLFERRRHARKRRVELRAQTLDHRDDGDRNSGSDQSVFNGGRAAIVIDETPNHTHHNSAPFRSRPRSEFMREPLVRLLMECVASAENSQPRRIGERGLSAPKNFAAQFYLVFQRDVERPRARAERRRDRVGAPLPSSCRRGDSGYQPSGVQRMGDLGLCGSQST